MSVEPTLDGVAQRRRARTAPVRRPRVLLFANAGVGNYGNDASVRVVAGMIRRAVPDADVVVVCPRPDKVREELGLGAVAMQYPRRGPGRGRPRPLAVAARVRSRLGDVQNAFRVTSDADALLVPGTGILDDFAGESAWGWPFFVLTWFAAGRRHGVPLGLVSVGAGPLAPGAARRVARLVARLADFQSYRDAGSRSFMVGLGVPETATGLAPDVALALPSPDRPPAQSDVPPVAVIAVMNYTGWQRSTESDQIAERHRATLAGLGVWLLDRGYRVRLMTVDGAGDGQATDAVAAAVRAASPELAAPALSVVTAGSLPDAVQLMSDAYLVVATRYHSVVAALVNSVPVISLGYASKNDELLDQFGLAGFDQHVERVDDNRLRAQISAVEERHDELSATISARLAEVRAALARQEAALGALIRSSRGRRRRRH